jgi:hypothetical protein
VHAPPWHIVPAGHANEEPQPPQLLVSVVKSTQAPLQRVYPPLHAKVHSLPAHAAVALAMLVEQAVVHAPQWLTLLVMSTQVPLQSVGVAGGQPETQLEPLHTGVPPLQACPVPQPPQLLLSLVKSTQAPLQRVYPLLHATAHALLTHAAVPCRTPVEHAWPHVPQSLA